MNRNFVLFLAVCAILAAIAVVYLRGAKNDSSSINGIATPVVPDPSPLATATVTIVEPTATAPAPTPIPTNPRTIVSKEPGELLRSRAAEYMKQTQNDLMLMRKNGTDTGDSPKDLRELLLQLSKAGATLYHATDAASTQQAENGIQGIIDETRKLRVKAGLPE